ncbi:carbohydrate ABC transporter permease [Geochorda subterranea]|uniref:Sugar ABC transporter permease n=1 Tax=Geochorda subterranea TaxID=3109564 RepID=A0ABZ1BLU9_9FIRM|nr:sugar ABC transporter permease [Limnochorda sp. LNt]WRP13742.1 sugar ABC transporter permease [Limnochorda sp. LNt]
MTPFLFVGPAVILLACVIVYPMVYGLAMSFTSLDPRLKLSWVGVANFARVFSNAAFWAALRQSVYFTVVSVAIHIILGMVIALALNRQSKLVRVVRPLFVLPWAVAPVIVATVWAWMYNPSYGIINETLLRVGLLSRPIPWLALPGYAMSAVIVANIWRGTPFVSLMFLAGLQAIPDEQYEAALVDGANGWHRFWYITVPNLRHVLLVVVILDTVWNFKLFDLVKVMTGGGPIGTTEVLPTLIYRTAFEYGDLGAAAAIAAVMLVLSVLAMYGFLRTFRELGESVE